MDLKWKQMAHRRPKDDTQIVWRYPQNEAHEDRKGLGLGHYLVEEADEWPGELEWIAYSELHALEVLE